MVYASFSSNSKTTPGRYNCNFCSYSTDFPTNLRAHKRTHTGEKPFICNICSKSFTQKANLQNHFRSHTGERPYECMYCKKGFSKKIYLQKHVCNPIPLQAAFCIIIQLYYCYKYIIMYVCILNKGLSKKICLRKYVCNYVPRSSLASIFITIIIIISQQSFCVGCFQILPVCF